MPALLEREATPISEPQQTADTGQAASTRPACGSPQCSPDTAASSSCTRATEPLGQGSQQYLCYFLHRHLSFRQAETQALAEAAGVQDLQWRATAGNKVLSPFWYLRLPSEEAAQKIAGRSMLLRGFYDLWGEGETLEELEASLRLLPRVRTQRFQNSSVSWKIVVDAWGKTMKLSDQVALINRLAFLDFKGPICLSTPDVVFRLIVSPGEDELLPGLPRGMTTSRWYFGREVAVSNRSVIPKYALPKRLYIGPTSMDTEMAFIICNLARIKEGHLVYDPFVGTGSILVAAAHLGAKTLGADIDVRVVRDGKLNADGQVVDNWANFQQYGLGPPVGLLRADAHLPPLRECSQGFLDAIVCDPPYGVRAGGRRSISGAENGVLSKAGHKGLEGGAEWVPPTRGYSLTECLQDLLACAAKHLRVGGRLVYFLPAAPETCQGANVPQHPALRFVSNCEQVLTRRYSRRLVTMEKVVSYDASQPVTPIDLEMEANLARIHDMVYDGKAGDLMKPKCRGKLC